MKKLTAIILVIVICSFALVSCGKKDAKGNKDTETSKETQTEAVSESDTSEKSETSTAAESAAAPAGETTAAGTAAAGETTTAAAQTETSAAVAPAETNAAPAETATAAAVTTAAAPETEAETTTAATASSTDPASAIIGTWDYKDLPDAGFQYVFNANGTGTYCGENFTYKVEGNTISIFYVISGTFKTEFSINGNELNIKDSGGNDTVYVKK